MANYNILSIIRNSFERMKYTGKQKEKLLMEFEKRQQSIDYETEEGLDWKQPKCALCH
jgi:hypothetical protein